MREHGVTAEQLGRNVYQGPNYAVRDRAALIGSNKVMTGLSEAGLGVAAGIVTLDATSLQLQQDIKNAIQNLAVEIQKQNPGMEMTKALEAATLRVTVSNFKDASPPPNPNGPPGEGN